MSPYPGYAPGDDRAGVEERQRRLGEVAAADVEREPRDDRRRRRPEQHRRRQQRVPVQDLHVVAQVVVQVAAGGERPGDRLDGVDGEGEEEEEKGAATPLRQVLQPRQGAREPIVAHRTII
jgi:hypothetical protein